MNKGRHGRSKHQTSRNISTSCNAFDRLSQVLRETKFHLLVGQTAILSQDWESAEMSLQLAVDMSGYAKLIQETRGGGRGTAW